METEVKEIPVLINLASLASYNGMTDDPIQVLTSGVRIPQETFYLLQYTETQEDESTGEVVESQIQLALKKDQVTMNRLGDFNNSMLFKKNRRFETTYHTPYGDMPMAIHTHDLRCEMGLETGKVHLKYELSMQGAYTSTNELHLEYFAKG